MKKISIFSKLVLILSIITVPGRAKADNNAPLIIAGGAVVGVGFLYVTGRASSAVVYALAKRRYEPEMELLQRMVYKPAVLEEELVPYILDCHEQANQSFFFNPGIYKNYPLLKYKNDLDWYINKLWYLQLFRLGTDMRHEISTFMDKLQIIRRYIITDYRFVREQRQFDER